MTDLTCFGQKLRSLKDPTEYRAEIDSPEIHHWPTVKTLVRFGGGLAWAVTIFPGARDAFFSCEEAHMAYWYHSFSTAVPRNLLEDNLKSAEIAMVEGIRYRRYRSLLIPSLKTDSWADEPLIELQTPTMLASRASGSAYIFEKASSFPGLIRSSRAIIRGYGDDAEQARKDYWQQVLQHYHGKLARYQQMILDVADRARAVKGFYEQLRTQHE